MTSAHGDYASANGHTTSGWVCGVALQSLVEASIRFVLSNPDLTTTLVGLSNLEQLDHAAQSAKKGPLPAEALKLISTIQHGFVGEGR